VRASTASLASDDPLSAIGTSGLFQVAVNATRVPARAVRWRGPASKSPGPALADFIPKITGPLS
jgi:hypothetical protein